MSNTVKAKQLSNSATAQTSEEACFEVKRHVFFFFLNFILLNPLLSWACTDINSPSGALEFSSRICFLNVSAYYNRLHWILWCLFEVWQSHLSQKQQRRNRIFKSSPFSIATFQKIHFSNLLLRVNAPCLCLYFKSRHGRAKRSGNSLRVNASTW